MNEQVRISRLRAQFLRKNIKVTNDWLEGCGEYFLGEKPGITDDELLEEAVKQFLLADLQEAGVPTIPEKVKADGIQTIEGRFVVQMQTVMDVSESPYDLLQQLYNKKTDETDTERQRWQDRPKKKRMLKLELTDGTNTVIGMEYSMISVLNVSLRPGTKLRIIGPLKCVDHILFLESKNVEVLGGEVDTLLVTNALENMLLRALNRPIKPNPRMEYSAALTQTGTNGFLMPTNNSNVARTNTRNVTNGFHEAPSSSFNSTASTVPMSSNPTNNDPFGDDDLLEEIDLRTIETQALTSRSVNNQQSTNRRPAIQSIPNDFSDDDCIDDLAELECQIMAERRACPELDPTFNAPGSSKDTASASSKRPSTSPLRTNQTRSSGPPSKISKPLIHPPIDVPMFDSFDEFDTIVHESRYQKVPTPPPPPKIIKYDAPNYKFRLEGCNLLTFEQLFTIPKENWKRQQFMFYAEIEKVSKALSITDNKWVLSLVLTDGSNSFNSKIDSDLLEKMIGYSAKEIKLMKQKSKSQPALREEILQILKIFDDKLKLSTKFWKIQFPDSNDSEELPVIISVSDLKPVYKRILLNKIDAEQLLQLKTKIPN